ncbi:hypothetical protein HIO71_13515 [Chryseobacterium aquaticum]|uniref:DUF6705 domain-containing protein n=1 Tax=Chryseobacterium aquaticum TaxID=452084 RepID=A0A848NCJ3_9FLAO|nr:MULTISPECIES: DUF6705 family protein [Chryseobacterium]NMR35203.1 hypothetical protein [Chryseobacterium aquaticum]NRQ47360.1 hypothetical protein [Chryseobacterium sp. C-204]
MKKIILFIIFTFTISCQAQTYPLRTYGIEFPKDSYVKDTNNELLDYEGTWKGTWNNKTIFVTFKKIKFYKSYLDYRAYFNDIIVGKFKVIDSNGVILYDNTSLPDNKAKIKGSNFKKVDNKYSLIYIDPDLCSMSGSVYINFTDATKTKLNWKAVYSWDIITESCPYYNATVAPEPLPYEIILTKQ